VAQDDPQGSTCGRPPMTGSLGQGLSVGQRGSRGSPSNRSASMTRSTSSVPPAIWTWVIGPMTAAAVERPVRHQSPRYIFPINE
jgi:hypothetical protein